MKLEDMTPDELLHYAQGMKETSAGQRVDLPLTPDEAAAQRRIGKATFGPNYENPKQRLPPQDPYAVTSWGETEYDFITPSGQRCRMKKLRPEELLETGLLDRVTRLPGFAEEQIEKAEGQPPKAAALPSKEDIKSLIQVLNELLPLVIVKPHVRSVPPPGQERVAGVVYTDMIELGDRMAIMERAMTGVKKLDNFREQPGGAVSGVVDEPGHAMPSE